MDKSDKFVVPVTSVQYSFENCMYCAVVAFVTAEEAEVKTTLDVFESWSLVSFRQRVSIHVSNIHYKRKIHSLLRPISKSISHFQYIQSDRKERTESRSSIWSVDSSFGTNVVNPRLTPKFSVNGLN
ncbi:hypothetical protein AVEN_242461-1 [Araneus ventricosus]|uniref:Uncharacterized protein n=1 Tax=Araneus ventricosus TaxID=182803 RepID=A0A4Y2J7J1_ARAVE|nr:hypothetical protein AVEN_242461-1 [Araneus ventricosus]